MVLTGTVTWPHIDAQLTEGQHFGHPTCQELHWVDSVVGGVNCISGCVKLPDLESWPAAGNVVEGCLAR
jgi:hypothetical protein